MVRKVQPEFVNPQGRIIEVDNVDTQLKQFAHFVFVFTNTSDVIITLPKANGIGGKQIYIKKMSTPGIVTIKPDPSESIDGADMIQISTLNVTMRFQSDNINNWSNISTSPTGGPPPGPPAQPTLFTEITDQIPQSQWMDFITELRMFDIPNGYWFWQDEFMYKDPPTDMPTQLEVFEDHPSFDFAQSVNVPNGAVEFSAGNTSGKFAYIRSRCSLSPLLANVPQIFKLRGGTTSSSNGKRWVLIGLTELLPTFAASVFVEPDNGIYFLRDNLIANYKAVCRSGGVSTEISLAAFGVTSGNHEIWLVDVAGVLHAQFFQDVGGFLTQVADISTNIPTAQLKGMNYLGYYDSVGPGSTGGHVDYMFMGAKR